MKPQWLIAVILCWPILTLGVSFAQTEDEGEIISSGVYTGQFFTMELANKKEWKLSDSKYDVGGQLGILPLINAQWTDCKVNVITYSYPPEAIRGLDLAGLQRSLQEGFEPKSFKFREKEKTSFFGAWGGKKLVGTEAEGVPYQFFKDENGKIIKKPDAQSRVFVKGLFVAGGYNSGKGFTMSVTYEYPKAFLAKSSTQRRVQETLMTVGTIQKAK